MAVQRHVPGVPPIKDELVEQGPSSAVLCVFYLILSGGSQRSVGGEMVPRWSGLAVSVEEANEDVPRQERGPVERKAAILEPQQT